MTLEKKLEKIRELGFTPVTVYKVGADEVIFVKDKKLYPYFYFDGNRVKEYPFMNHPEIFKYMKTGKNVIWGDHKIYSLKYYK